MIISSSNDYREAARRRLPPFLFHYIFIDLGVTQHIRT